MHLLDTTMFYAPEGGGVGRYLQAKRQWLRRATPSVRHTLLVPGAADTDDGAGRVCVRAPQIPRSGGYRFPLTPAGAARRMVELAPDIIEAGDPYVLAWAALRAGRMRGIPVVAFYHSDLARMVQSRLGAACGAAVERYARHLYRRFDLVLAPSRHMEVRLRSMGIERVAVRPLGVDTDAFHPSRRDEEFRRQLGLSRDARLLVFAGRFAPEKNLPLLYAALRLLGPGYHLVLVGGGASLPRQGNVSVLPYHADPRALATVLASCDAFVHAGDQETFGLVVLEAMACGLPVAGVTGGAVTELISDEVGCVVPNGAAHALAEGVTALFERDVAAMGAAARVRACAHYSWDVVMPALMTCHYGLVGRAGAADWAGYAAR